MKWNEDWGISFISADFKLWPFWIAIRDRRGAFFWDYYGLLGSLDNPQRGIMFGMTGGGTGKSS